MSMAKQNENNNERDYVLEGSNNNNNEFRKFMNLSAPLTHGAQYMNVSAPPTPTSTPTSTPTPTPTAKPIKNNSIKILPSEPDTLYKEQSISNGKSISNGIEKFIPSREINIKDEKIADILQAAIKNDTLKEIYEDTDNNYLVRIFNYFINKKFKEAYTNFEQPTSEDIEDIIQTITEEKQNKVIFLKSKLYLYDIDYYIQQYIKKKLEPNKTITGEDTEIDEINNNYAKFFSYQNQPNLSFNYRDKFIQDDIENDGAQYIDMYSSLLLNKKAKDFKNNETKITGGGGNDLIYNLSKLNNKSKIKTKVKNSIEASYVEHWKTLKNESTPMLEKKLFTLNSEFTPPDDSTHSMTSLAVRNYLLKCEDLQLFYINKHILIYELMKKLSDLVKYNKTMCEQINNLTSPTIFINKKNNSINVELKNLLTEIGDKNKYDSSSIQMVNKMMSSDGKSVIKPIKIATPPSNNRPDVNFLTLEKSDDQWFDGSKAIKDFGKNVYLIDDDSKFTKQKEVTIEELITYLKDDAVNLVEYLKTKKFYIKFGDKLKNFKDYMFTDSTGAKEIILSKNLNTFYERINDEIKGNVEIDYEKEYIIINLENINDFAFLNNNDSFEKLTITIPKLHKYIIKIKDNTIFNNIRSGKTIYYKSPSTDPITEQDELLMIYKLSTTTSASSYFENINIKSPESPDLNTKYSLIDKICKNFKIEFLETKGTFNTVRYYIDSIASFNTLHYIKQLQDNNYASLLSILGEKTTTGVSNKYNIDQQIEEYKRKTDEGVVDKFKTLPPSNPFAETKIVDEDNAKDNEKWQNFEEDNQPVKQYFKNKLASLNDGDEITDRDHLQQVIYRCYDLQVLYMIKHLEVIYINNSIYYYMDMLAKQVSVMLFILSLYKRNSFDINEIGTNNIKDAFKSISELVSGQENVKQGVGVVSGGGNGNINPKGKDPRYPTYNAALPLTNPEYVNLPAPPKSQSPTPAKSSSLAPASLSEKNKKDHGYMELSATKPEPTYLSIGDPPDVSEYHEVEGEEEPAYASANPATSFNDRYLQTNFTNSLNTDNVRYSVARTPNVNDYVDNTKNQAPSYASATSAIEEPVYGDIGYTPGTYNSTLPTSVTTHTYNTPPIPHLTLTEATEIEQYIKTYYTNTEDVKKKLNELKQKYEETSETGNAVNSNSSITLKLAYDTKSNTLATIADIKAKIAALPSNNKNNKQKIDLLNKIYYNLIMLSINDEFQEIKALTDDNKKSLKLKELYKKIEQTMPNIRKNRKGKNAFQLYGLSSIVHHAKDDMEWFFNIEKVLFDTEEVDFKFKKKQLEAKHTKLKEDYKTQIERDIPETIITHIEDYDKSTLIQKEVENRIKLCEDTSLEKCDEKKIETLNKNKIKIDTYVKKTSIGLIKSILGQIKFLPDSFEEMMKLLPGDTKKQKSETIMKMIDDLTDEQLKTFSDLLSENLLLFMADKVDSTNIYEFEVLSQKINKALDGVNIIEDDTEDYSFAGGAPLPVPGGPVAPEADKTLFKILKIITDEKINKYNQNIQKSKELQEKEKTKLIEELNKLTLNEEDKKTEQKNKENYIEQLTPESKYDAKLNKEIQKFIKRIKEEAELAAKEKARLAEEARVEAERVEAERVEAIRVAAAAERVEAERVAEEKKLAELTRLAEAARVEAARVEAAAKQKAAQVEEARIEAERVAAQLAQKAANNAAAKEKSYKLAAAAAAAAAQEKAAAERLAQETEREKAKKKAAEEAAAAEVAAAKQAAEAAAKAAKDSIKGIINDLNFQAFINFLQLYENTTKKPETIKSELNDITPAVFFKKLDALIEATLKESKLDNLTLLLAQANEIKEKIKDFTTEKITEYMKALNESFTNDDLFKTLDYLRTVKPLNLCYKRLEKLDPDSKEKKFAEVIVKMKILPGEDSINAEILEELMEEANTIHNQIKEGEKSTAELKSKLEAFAKKPSVVKVTTDENVRLLYEIIGGAASVMLRFKNIRTENTAPTIGAILDNVKEEVSNEEKIKNFKVKDYIKYMESNDNKNTNRKITIQSTKKLKTNFDENPLVQSAGYIFNDITNIDDTDGTITIGDICNQGTAATKPIYDAYKYGPYAGIYDTRFNNFDIYAYLFGITPMGDTTTTPTEIETIIPKSYADSTHGSLVFNGNAPQNFIKKLDSGGNIVLFGYGFSGSGKTYTLLEGQTYDSTKIKTTEDKYDPSLIEQFIKENSEKIESVSFIDIYPLGQTKERKNKKIFYGKNAEETIKTIYGGNITSFAESEEKYDTIKGAITYEIISKRIKEISVHRRNHLRILSTPNNDESSRSFLQITLNLKEKNNKLVFFDMPGSENTVRIKAEFLGAEPFVNIEKLQKNFNDTNKIPFQSNDPYEMWKDSNYLTHIKMNKFNVTGDTKKNHYITFKDALISRANFITLSGCGVGDNSDDVNKKIANVTEALALFLNGKTEDNILDLTPETVIAIPDANIIKSIVKNFFDKVIFKEKEKKDKPYNKEYDFEYFKMDLKDNKYKEAKKKTDIQQHEAHFNLTDEDINNIEEIYDINIKKIDKDKEDSVLFWNNDGKGVRGSYSIYNSTTNIPAIDTKTYNFDTFYKYFPQYKLMYNLRAFKDGKVPEHNSNEYIYNDYGKPNPMIKYFLLIINTIIGNYYYDYNPKKKKQVSDEPDLYRIILFFIYKYINFIVKQGSAIVTNLEHLKFFFLSNTDNIDRYNSTYPEKAFVCGDSAENCDSLKKNDIIYFVDTAIGKKQIQEKVNIGRMDEYRLLAILQNLANKQSIIKDLKNKKTIKVTISKEEEDDTIIQKYTLNLDDNIEGAPTQSTLFSTIVCIKNFLDNENDNTDKLTDKTRIICSAEYDSLEFAENISSTTQGKKRIDYLLNADEQKALKEKAEDAAAKAAAASAVAASFDDGSEVDDAVSSSEVVDIGSSSGDIGGVTVSETQARRAAPAVPSAEVKKTTSLKKTPTLKQATPKPASAKTSTPAVKKATKTPTPKPASPALPSPALPSPEPASPEFYKATYDGDTVDDKDSELLFKENDIFIKIEAEDVEIKSYPLDTWIKVYNFNAIDENPSIGFVPSNYTEPIQNPNNTLKITAKDNDESEIIGGISLNEGDEIKIKNIDEENNENVNVINITNDDEGIVPLNILTAEEQPANSSGGSRSKNLSKKIPKRPQRNFIKKILSFENKKSPKKFNMKELTQKHKKHNRIQTVKKQLKTNNKKTLYSRRSKKYQK